MKKFVMILAVAAALLVADSQLASAGRRGGRGGCGGGGCGGGGCGGGGYVGGYGGGCGMGGCGMGGFGGYAGCQTCGGYVMGAGAGSYAGGSCVTCSGGVCTINATMGGTLVAQADVNQATLVVNLPEDATLTVDNEPTSSTSGNRVFVTPSLEAGKEYEYTLKAQVVRDGKVRTATAQVTVRPGEVSSVELQIPSTGVAAQ